MIDRRTFGKAIGLAAAAGPGTRDPSGTTAGGAAGGRPELPVAPVFERMRHVRAGELNVGYAELGLTVQTARARLLYGEWVRRESRRSDAREQLRAAYEVFAAAGADGFAERSSRELAAAGETVHRRSVGASGKLTAQEAQIARLAVSGRTNPEIGAELFLNPRTVEWHLRKVLSKLGIGSRRELAAALRER